MKLSTYDRFPVVSVPASAEAAVVGWTAIGERLRTTISKRAAQQTRVVVECYPGTDENEIFRELSRVLRPSVAIATGEALRSVEEIEALVAPFLGGGDPVFGRMNGLQLEEFFDPIQVTAMKGRVAANDRGVVLVVGVGARLVHAGDVLLYADLARWEAQLRFRRQETGNLGAANLTASTAAKYKRAFFVDWRAADRWKQPMMKAWDFVLDTNDAKIPKLVEGDAVRRGLQHATTRPFRVVPFFDPAPWGGQWMREVFGLDTAAPNYGWGFDCVPEENSLLLQFGEVTIELPALDLVLFQPRELLGRDVQARFGDEFPIRFDLLDTIQGGNLSLQVHPLTAYIREHFGMSYTQDESYYMLDAASGAEVYLGLRNGIDPVAMAHGLQAAQAGGAAFPADDFAARWPARKHDHFLIPAGTVHCGGANGVVLEISATPYIFTFKLWDWGRRGLDGKPRTIHLQHGLANVRWERDATWTKANLINQFVPLESGPGWRAERTGLHELQFIETRRHWFTQPVVHDTAGGVHVLNLVEGAAAVVESPEQRFEPFTVHYAETFIVPANVGAYVVRPAEPTMTPLATLQARVRP